MTEAQLKAILMAKISMPMINRTYNETELKFLAANADKLIELADAYDYE